MSTADRLRCVTSDPGAALRAAFAAAYRPYVESRLAELGASETPGIDSAVVAGQSWLDEELAELLAQPFSEQDRSPLEVLQEAMRFPTEELEAAGVESVVRDMTESVALPGDRYGLAPASSQELGEEAWRAHLAWGVAKAHALALPRVGLLAADAADRSSVEAAVSARGFRFELWDDLAGVHDAVEGRGPVLAFVDLDHRDSDRVLQALAEAGVRVIGYGAGVDDLATVRAQTLGAVDALPRQTFLGSIADFLPRLL